MQEYFNADITCGDVDIVSSATFMTIHKEKTLIKTPYIKIKLDFDEDGTTDGGYFYRIGQGEMDLTLHNVLSRMTVGSPEPIFLGHYHVGDKKKRLYLTFGATRIDGCRGRLFNYTLYLSPDGAEKYSWEEP